MTEIRFFFFFFEYAVKNLNFFHDKAYSVGKIIHGYDQTKKKTPSLRS